LRIVERCTKVGLILKMSDQTKCWSAFEIRTFRNNWTLLLLPHKRIYNPKPTPILYYFEPARSTKINLVQCYY